MTLEKLADQFAAYLFNIAQAQPVNGEELALRSIAQFNPCRGAAASEVLILKFRDMPVHNRLASFIFDELARDILRRH